MKLKLPALVVALGAALVLGGCGASRVESMTGSVLVEGLSAREVREIARPHGVLGRAPLAIAARRRLQPGQPLPAGIPIQPVPAAMLDALPVVEGHDWRIAGIDLLLVETSSMRIADILRSPFR